MKNIALTFLVLISLSYEAQNVKVIQKDSVIIGDVTESNIEAVKFINKYMENVYMANYDAILQDIYPPMFKLIAKPDMRKEMVKYYEGNEVYSIDIGKEVPLYNISQVYRKDSARYAFVDFDLRMSVTYQKPVTEEAQEAVIANAKSKGDEAYFINDSRMNLIKRNVVLTLINNYFSDFEWTVLNFNEEDLKNLRVMPIYVKNEYNKIILDLIAKN